MATFHGARKNGPHIFLIGHCDTVFSEGTAAQRPFTIKDGIAYGPGVVDMKGCLVVCQFAMEALLAEGFEEFTKIQILYDTDEERGNPSSKKVIERIGEDAAAALIIESGACKRFHRIFEERKLLREIARKAAFRPMPALTRKEAEAPYMNSPTKW